MENRSNKPSQKRIFRIGTVDILLPGSLRKVIEIENLRIALLDTSDFIPNVCDEFNRNVFAYDTQGGLIWRIQALPGFENVPASYTNIWKHNNDTLLAYSHKGYEMRVDLKTGQVDFWKEPGKPPGQRPW